jgi:hypothetical protein
MLDSEVSPDALAESGVTMTIDRIAFLSGECRCGE